MSQVQKQYQRSHIYLIGFREMPVYGTIASQFNDPGTNALFAALIEKLNEKRILIGKYPFQKMRSQKSKMSLFRIADVIIYVKFQKRSDTIIKNAEEQVEFARKLFQLEGPLSCKGKGDNDELLSIA